MKELSEYPVEKVRAFIRSTCERYREGDTAGAFASLIRQALLDERESVAITVAESLPFPDKLDSDPHAGRDAEILATLPGLAAAANGEASFKVQAAQDAATKELKSAEENPFHEIYATAERVRYSAPLWYAVLTDYRALVRFAAAARIPATGSVLSPLLVLMATDSSKRVRDKVRSVLDLPARKAWRSIALGAVVLGVGAAKRAAVLAGEAEDEKRLLDLFADTRIAVRLAVANQFKKGSPHLGLAAQDTSPKVRALAAQRVEMQSEDFKRLLRDADKRVSDVCKDRVGRGTRERRKRVNWWDDEEGY